MNETTWRDPAPFADPGVAALIDGYWSCRQAVWRAARAAWNPGRVFLTQPGLSRVMPGVRRPAMLKAHRDAVGSEGLRSRGW